MVQNLTQLALVYIRNVRVGQIKGSSWQVGLNRTVISFLPATGQGNLLLS